MTSSVYVQDGTSSTRLAPQIDRENVYLLAPRAAAARSRAIRDAMLAVTGLLDETMYGPGTLDPNDAAPQHLLLHQAQPADSRR